MTRHFGVLIPCRLLPATYRAHVGRLAFNGGDRLPAFGRLLADVP